MAIGVWISLGLYFSLMLAIGFYALRQASASSEGYLLAGRSLSPGGRTFRRCFRYERLVAPGFARSSFYCWSARGVDRYRFVVYTASGLAAYLT